MARMLEEPARTVVLTAALTGLRKKRASRPNMENFRRQGIECYAKRLEQHGSGTKDTPEAVLPSR